MLAIDSILNDLLLLLISCLVQLTRSKTRTGTHAQDAQFAATARQEVGSP